MQCVTTPLLVVKCVDLIQVCVASGCAWQARSQNLSEEVASIPAFPPRRMVKPRRMPIPMRLRFLRLRIILRPEIMLLYLRHGRESQKAKRKMQKAKVRLKEQVKRQSAKCKSKVERTSQKAKRKMQKAKVRLKEQVKRQNAKCKRQK